MSRIQRIIDNYKSLYANCGVLDDSAVQEIQGDYVRNWIVASANRMPGADELLDVIFTLWGDRKKDLPQFISADRPDWGVMRSLGYRVGKKAIEKRLTVEHRHLILEFAFHAAALPPIKDKTYMGEWGKAKSYYRYLKIKRFLEAMILDYEDSLSMKFAVDDWRCDLRFVECKLYPQAQP